MNKRKVFIVEDMEDIRNGYVFLINQSANFNCTGYVSAEAALAAIETNKPAVILMDVNLPGMSGIECTRKIKMRYPDILIMMFTVYENNENIFSALEAGASGYILKQSTPADLMEAIEELCSGGSPMSSTIARKVVNSFKRSFTNNHEDELSPREREVLELLAEGHRYKDIGDKLYISISTVRSHIQKIYDKLHVHNRTEALNKYRANPAG
ncbi:MAG: response regulator transcription factor [Ferruginibacter sp.]